jgi:hypothetical protein
MTGRGYTLVTDPLADILRSEAKRIKQECGLGEGTSFVNKAREAERKFIIGLMLQ